MASSTPLEQLQSLLGELFQLDNSDLDFGIYRILNLKHKEIEEFIEKLLPKRIEEVRQKILARQSIDLLDEIERLKKPLTNNFQVDFQQEGDLDAKASQYGQLPFFKEQYDKYIEAKKKLDALHLSEDTERSIYNELYRFFDRYYEGGDFISKPRAGANNYMIPYNGEEVKLYWANHDQYYIKTSENFKNYIFTNNSQNPETLVTVEFKIVDAEANANNNKAEKKRLFVPTEKPIEWDQDTRKLSVNFYYKEPSSEDKTNWGDKQSVKKEGKGINQRLNAELEKIVKKTKDTELTILWQKTRKTSRGEEQPIFLYHLNRYTSINSFDYFIHKDLRGFLSRELDYFLKNEILSVNFLDPDWRQEEVQEAIKLNVLKASAIRDLALAIIDFLGELENFQKRLWEKKKFVVQSDYCLTLDIIPSSTAGSGAAKDSVLDEVLDFIMHDKEEKQIKEWVNLGFISDKKDLKNLKSELKNDKSNLRYLVLDTQFLPENLKWEILASIDNLDQRTNGLLVNSENWQAMNLLLPKFSGRVDCNYIDPPFNSETTDFVYKNSYKHSSWLAMAVQNLSLARKLLSPFGVLNCAIDDFEILDLGHGLNSVFGADNRLGFLVIEIKPSGRTQDEYLATSHEYVLIYAVNKENAAINFRELTEEQKAEYKFSDEISAYKWRDFLRTGGYSTPEERPNSFYPIFYDPKKDKASLEPRPSYIKIHPIDSDGKKRVWRKTKPSFWKHYQKGDIKFEMVEGEYKVKIKDRIKEGVRPKSVWVGSQYDASSHGTKLLKKMFGESPFSFPKSVYAVKETIALSTDSNSIILDQFAGSATTGQAVIDLNRDDEEEGLRRYLLVEMNKYFDRTTKSRIQKTIFSHAWRDGKSEKDGKGISQIFQYLKLEQYEDTLNNIDFRKDVEQLPLVERLQYLLTYGTQGSDCLLNVEKFSNPFGYTMKIVRQNEVNPEQAVDLVATFNYFLGIDVLRYVIENHQAREYHVVLGKKREQEYIIVWRRFEEGKLDLTEERDWVRKQSWYKSESIIFCNADNGFGARSIEAEFKRIMMEPVE